MKFKIPILILVSLIILTTAAWFVYHHSNRTQVISNPAKMQMCNDTGLFTKLSGTKTKAWGFGVNMNMMFNGSVACIYDGFGKPAISSIIFSKNKKEAQIYVQTDNRILDQNRVQVILPAVSTIQVFDSETNESYLLYPEAFRDLTNEGH
jgi:hypothetical protein